MAVLTKEEVAEDKGSLPRQVRPCVTWRAILIAVILMPFHAWWIVQMEVVRYNTWPTMLSLPLHTLFLLLLFVAINNGILKRWIPRWALSQTELLTIYVMLAIAGVIVGYGILQALIGWIVAPVWRATNENRWNQLFSTHLTEWLHIKDKERLRPFFEGNANFFAGANLRAWLVPMLAWSGFFLALFVAVLCINTLLRRRWIEEERLTFPIVQVPLEITEPTGRLFRTRLLWFGFGITMLLGTLNGLHFLFPTIPSAQLDVTAANQAFSAPPWNVIQVGGPPFFPPYTWAIGVAIFMPLDVSFSYWFFFWFMKLQQLLTLVWGWDVVPEAPFRFQQCGGALLAIGLYSLWSARRHLAQVIRNTLRPGRDLGDADEPLPYRVAFVLLIVCIAVLAVFIWAAGLSVWLVPIFLALYLIATVALSRLRAELGAPANEIVYGGPHIILAQVVGPQTFASRDLTLLAVLAWTSRSYGMDPTPNQIEGFKMAERVGFRTPGLVGAMLIAAVVGLLTGFPSLLAPFYRLGAGTVKMQWDQVNHAAAVYEQLQSWLTGTAPNHALPGLAIQGGFLFALFLFFMRSRFLWWPFHPMGYVMSPMWFAHHLWLSIFIAWLIKFLLLRHGGRKAYTSALPFFIGIILGDCVIGSIWALVNLIFQIPTFSVWM